MQLTLFKKIRIFEILSAFYFCAFLFWLDLSCWSTGPQDSQSSWYCFSPYMLQKVTWTDWNVKGEFALSPRSIFWKSAMGKQKGVVSRISETMRTLSPASAVHAFLHFTEQKRDCPTVPWPQRPIQNQVTPPIPIFFSGHCDLVSWAVQDGEW